MADPVPSSAIYDATAGGISVLLVTGGSTGDVLTRQSDGTYVPATPAGGSYAAITGATGSLVLPSGTTAQRDGTPAVGYSRWNTTTGRFERWTGSTWENYVRLSGDTMTGQLGLPSIAGPGGTASLTIDNAGTGGTLLCFNAGNRAWVGNGGLGVYLAAYPMNDNLYDLGLTTRYWRTLYVNSITCVGAVTSGAITASGTISNRNGSTAQKIEIYNTYTSSTVYERAVIDWVTTTNTCKIGTEKGSGGGTARDLCFVTDATARLTLNGTTGIATFSTQVVLAASTTSLASLNVPHGSAPSSPTNGDFWTTTAGQYARINGVSHKIGGETRSIGLVIDGGGSAITTGVKAYLRVPYDCVVTGWSLLADQSGSIVIDVWKDTYANYPPTVADTIAGSEKPTLSAASKNEDTSLSTWTTALSAGDVIGFNVDSASTVTRVQLSLNVRLI